MRNNIEHVVIWFPFCMCRDAHKYPAFNLCAKHGFVLPSVAQLLSRSFRAAYVEPQAGKLLERLGVPSDIIIYPEI